MSSAIVECWNCGQKLRINTDKLSMARCSNCQQPIERPTYTRTEGKKPEMKEYKVLTQKDGYWSGKFDPEKLQTGLNNFAREGWRVVSMTTVTFSTMMGSDREELIILLEKEK